MITKSKDGINVGDRVEYTKDGKTYTGYVAVIDPEDNGLLFNVLFFLLRLEGYGGYDENSFWNKDWYPESEKKNEDNCTWCRKVDFKVVERKDENLIISCPTKLKNISRQLKKLFSPSLQKQYRVGYRNEDGSYTEKAEEFILEFYGDKKECQEKMTEQAEEDIKEVEDK